MSSSRPSRFEAEIADPDAGLARDLSRESEVLLIAFGGLGGGMGGGMPAFEFFKSVSRFEVNKVLVRDHNKSWYHRGVRGVGDTIDAVADSLARLVADSGVRRTVTIGNSAGGYGALLFGHLLAVDEVHAFSPQAFIDPAMLEAIGDVRWVDRIDDLVRSGRLDPHYADLAPVLAKSSGAGTRFQVYHAEPPLDRIHADHLRGVEGLELRSFEEGGHRLIRRLRDNGELHELLEQALRAPD